MPDSGLDARLDGLATAGLSLQVRAMLGVLDKMGRTPAALGPRDFEPLRQLGVSDDAIASALQVAWLFHIINRMADALQFEVGDDASFRASARMLLSRGYRM